MTDAPKADAEQPPDPNRVIFLNPREPAVSPFVHRAVQELIKKNLDPAGYVVSAMKKGPRVTITFTDKDAPRGSMRGSPGTRPALAVELDEATREVVKTYGVR